MRRSLAHSNDARRRPDGAAGAWSLTRMPSSLGWTRRGDRDRGVSAIISQKTRPGDPGLAAFRASEGLAKYYRTRLSPEGKRPADHEPPPSCSDEGPGTLRRKQGPRFGLSTERPREANIRAFDPGPGLHRIRSCSRAVGQSSVHRDADGTAVRSPKEPWRTIFLSTVPPLVILRRRRSAAVGRGRRAGLISESDSSVDALR